MRKKNRSESPMVNPKSLANLKPPFEAGKSPNPGGKPKATRNALQGNFFRVLSEDFEKHGKKAIVEMRETKPAEYVKVVASLMPKEFEITKPLDEISDDELNAALAAVKAVMAAQAGKEEQAEVASE